MEVRLSIDIFTIPELDAMDTFSLYRWSQLLIPLAMRISVVKTHILPKSKLLYKHDTFTTSSGLLGEDTGSGF